MPDVYDKPPSVEPQATIRFAFPAAELRTRAIRGVLINATFFVLVEALGLAQGLVVTRILGPAVIGLFGVVNTTILTLMDLKQVGIDEAFVQQSEADQEAEFQKAFTVELVISAVFALVIALAAPVVALAYGHGQLLFLMLASSYFPLLLALQAPVWIFFRKMDFVRQRALQGTVAVTTAVTTVPLAVAGFGVWSLIIGPFVGNLVAAVVTIYVSPYRLRLRWDRKVVRRYLGFSVPVFATAFGALIVYQGQVGAFTAVQGLAGAGFITLAVTLSRYVDRADLIVATTMYPAICAIQGRRRQLAELFTKSNRATMMWALPFSVGLVLFAPDLVHFLLGHKWVPAIVLLQGLGVSAGLNQLFFNWFSFYRAHGVTVPTAVEALVACIAFAAITVPALVVWGTVGFVIGRVAMVLVTLTVRVVYVRRLLPQVNLVQLVLRASKPLVPAVISVLLLRTAAWGDGRTALQALAELGLFVILYAIGTLWLERPLIGELVGALRARRLALGGS